MSGFIEVKLSSVSARGFSTWKTWKKQWCILRPHPVKQGILLTFDSSSGKSQIEIPKGSIVCRTNSKSKEYAFGIYSSVSCQRSILLLAGQSESESQLWMSRIRTMLDRKERSDINLQLNNCFHASLIENEFSNICGYRGLYGKVKLDIDFFEICDTISGQTKALFKFSEINSIDLICNCTKKVDNQKIIIIKTNSNFKYGLGKITFFSLSASVLTNKLKSRLYHLSSEVIFRKLDRRISRSEGTLFTMANLRKSDDSERDSGLSSCEPIRRTSNTKWYCSLDPIMRLSINDDEVVLKGKSAASLISAGLMLSTPGCPAKAKEKMGNFVKSNETLTSLTQTSDFSESSFDRRLSDVSVVSGVYEEILDPSVQSIDPYKLKKYRKSHDNTYEVLAECVYGTARRHSKKTVPPPLPPRGKIHPRRFDSTSDSGLDEESMYSVLSSSPNHAQSYSLCGSLNSIPHYMMGETVSVNENTEYSRKISLPMDDFRNRVQSDPQNIRRKIKIDKRNNHFSSMVLNETTTNSPKKKFEFNVTPSKSLNILKNCKMAKAFRKLSDMSSIDARDSTKSCETLDSENVNMFINRRCSKSEENFLDLKADDNDYKWHVDMSDENITDLSVIYAENNFKKAYPEELLELVLKGETNVAKYLLKCETVEDDYVIMSPNGSNDISSNRQVETMKPSVAIEAENNYVIMKGV